MVMYWFAVILAGLAIAVAAPDAAAQQSRLSARLDSAIRNHHDGGAKAGIAVAVMRGQDTLLLRA
jgi:hypothetical protein